MKYYEIWFYFYGENDTRTNFKKEYTFYMKVDKKIKTKEELIIELKKNFPKTEKFNVEGINCISNDDYEHLTNWFEIDAAEFTLSCGVPA